VIVEKRNAPSFTWMYGVALVVAAVVFIIGAVLAARSNGWAMLAAGAVSVVAVLVTWPLASAIQAFHVSDQERLEGMILPFQERMQQMNVMLNLMSEQQLISDRTKAIAYRAKDREVIRRAIQEEIGAKDWEMATALANDMERVFGFREEAQRFRKDIDAKKTSELRKQIVEATQVVDRHVRNEHWPEALAEAHRIAQQWPADEQAQKLPQQVEERRAAHKRQLIESWQDAIARRDVDGSIEILRKLDPYLSPQEAEAMQEPARNLFKEKLNSLRTQFSLAVTDHRWAEAIRVGEIMIRDFPNTRAAQEARDMLPHLKQRESEPETAPA
jgi:hypothetical protein